MFAQPSARQANPDVMDVDSHEAPGGILIMPLAIRLVEECPT